MFVSGIVDQQLAARDSPELVAERELEKWDRLPLVAPLFMPDPESGAVPIKLADYHLNLLSRGALTYLPRAALAAQGKQGSAANTERQFRGVAFVNDLRRVNMKHPTIARLSYICENKRHVPPNRTILTGYKRRISDAAAKRKAAGKRGADDGASAPAEATAADAGDAFDFSVDFDSAAAGAAAAADAALDALVSIMNDREELISWTFGEGDLVGAAAAGAGDGEGAAVASAIAGACDDDAKFEAEVVAVQTDAAGPLPGPEGEWKGLPPGPLGGAAAAAVAAAGAPDLAAAAAPAAAAAAGRD